MFDKIKFDERLKVAYESDFGYELSKLGKILYNPKAIIYHSHRATWSEYFHQQRQQAKYNFSVMIRHKKTIKGDHITQGHMILQIALFGLAIIFLFFHLFASLAFFVMIGIIFLKRIKELKVKGKDVTLMLGLFVVRLIASSIGLVQGVLLWLDLES